ncbi:MAG: hypothetical protein R3F19_11160 [Verrucomicrobiales bacterium]|nr:hypothetical protein [Verrucomicrobiae bacterium]
MAKPGAVENNQKTFAFAPIEHEWEQQTKVYTRLVLSLGSDRRMGKASTNGNTFE